MQKDAKVESFQKLIEGDLFWHDKENTGNKMQRLNQGVDSIGNFMGFYTDKGVSMVISLIGIIVVFTYFDIKYALIATLFIIVYVFADFLFNKKLAQKNLDVQIAKEHASGKSYEFSSNISTVKSLGIEKSLGNEIKNSEDKIVSAKNSRRNTSTIKWISIQTISSAFYVLFIFMVGKGIISGVLTIGSIVIYVTYVAKIQDILNAISSNAESLTESKYGVYRMMEIYNSIPHVDETGCVELDNWNEILIENVSFKYKEEEVLENFNLKIKKGERIGIVGKSGSGKSTLFKLLLKLYVPQKGKIYFGSMPTTSLAQESIVKKFSIVPQETELFNMSFRENILVAVPGEMNTKQYNDAIEISQCVPIISKIKEKDLALIGEKGIRLSGGERQRLGIARALYRNSDIIIFDESTSNLDYETERKIQDALDKKLKDKTLIFAAHRLSTLRNMDKILVIDRGKIVEEGSYQNLIKKKGEFYKLLKKQESSERKYTPLITQ
jgi:ABC-type multidrug transport system fused ATPase/permease subunit